MGGGANDEKKEKESDCVGGKVGEGKERNEEGRDKEMEEYEKKKKKEDEEGKKKKDEEGKKKVE